METAHSVALQTNPFGSAKPVDTSSKLKEFEERIAKEKVGAWFLHHFHAAVVPACDVWVERTSPYCTSCTAA